MFLGTPARNRSPPSDIADQQTGGGGGGGGGGNNGSAGPPVLDFNAELTKHLTLKRQKNSGATVAAPPSPQPQPTEANLRTNRGPPPQPPAPRVQPVVKTAPVVTPPTPTAAEPSSLFKKQLNR